MRRINLIAVAIFTALMIWVFRIDDEQTAKIQGAVLTVFSPFFKIAPQHTGRDSESLDPAVLAKENAEMRAELDRLTVLSQNFARISEENERFRKMLDYREQFAFSLIPARVLRRTSSNWWNSVVINKGANHGIGPDYPVLTPEGLVGKTAQVGDDTCVVILLTDERCRVASRIQGTSEQGIVMGQRGGLQTAPDLMMRFLSKGTTVEPGRKVFSSGAGKVFPPGILLGTVKSFRDLEIYGEASLVPEVDFSDLSDVFVVEMEGRASEEEDSATAQPVDE